MEYIYICNTSSDSLSVIDPVKFNETYKIDMRNNFYDRVGPHGICKYSNNKLLIANNYSNTLSLVDMSSRTVVEDFFIGMHCNDVKVYEKYAYIICGDINSIIVFDIEKEKIEEQIPCGNLPHSIDFFDGKIVTADLYGDTITYIDFNEKNTINIIKVGKYPTKAIFSADGKYILVCESNLGSFFNGNIRIISLEDFKCKSCIKVGNYPVDICYNEFDNLHYVSNFGDGTVSIIDIVRYAEIKKIFVGGMPRGIIAKNNNLYVGDNYNNLLINFDLNSPLKKYISIGKEPTGMILA